MKFEQQFPKLQKIYTSEGYLKYKNENNEEEIIKGEPATEEEKNELAGLTSELGFVPKEPEKAIEYYNRKRFNVLNRYKLSHTETMDLFRYYNKKLFDIYLNNSKLREQMEKENEGMKRFSGESLGKKFQEVFEKRLLEVSKGEFYSLSKGISVETADTFRQDFFGYSFKLQITDTPISREGNINEYTFDLVDKNSGKIFSGRIKTDIDHDKVDMVILPQIKNKKDSKPTVSEKVKALIGIYHLLRRPVYENTLYQGGREKGGEKGSYELTDVGKEVKETMFPFKRRTVDNLADAWKKAEELLASLSESDRDFLEKSLGSVMFNVHFVNFSRDNREGRKSVFGRNIRNAGRVGECQADRADVETLVGSALSDGTAVISIHGGWIPPELENAPAGKPKRPHIRRLVTKIVLVAGKDFEKIEDHKKIKEIFHKKSKGERITEEEGDKLDAFLKKYEMNNPFEIGFVPVDKEGIHYANGSFQEGRNHRGGKEGGHYVIKPKRMVQN